jgi:glycosyltransferase involved in cell wall biosynthesis
VTFLDQVTPLILTWNEAPNIGRTLERLNWASDVVVVDSGSTDGTLEMLGRHPSVRVCLRPFTSHAEQWNFGLTETSIATEWILALDADYVLSEELGQELRLLEPPADVTGFVARFVYWSLERPLRGSLYPPKVVLFRRHAGRFVQDGHTQRLVLEGRTRSLSYAINHDDRKDPARWRASQQAYALLEAARIRAGSASWRDRLRWLGLGPVAAGIYSLVVKRAALDGRAGWYYARQRAFAEALLVSNLWSGR